jgi:hypothetical protein
VRALVLHNPTAGSGDVAADDLLAALAAGGVAARYCSTKQPEFADALGEPADMVVVAGGDGTVAKVIRHLRDRRLPLAILPLGGANNIACSLGITADPLAIARTGWREAEARRLDSAPPPVRGASGCSSRRSASARSPRRRPRSLSGICRVPKSRRWRAKLSASGWPQHDRGRSGSPSTGRRSNAGVCWPRS